MHDASHQERANYEDITDMTYHIQAIGSTAHENKLIHVDSFGMATFSSMEPIMDISHHYDNSLIIRRDSGLNATIGPDIGPKVHSENGFDAGSDVIGHMFVTISAANRLEADQNEFYYQFHTQTFQINVDTCIDQFHTNILRDNIIVGYPISDIFVDLILLHKIISGGLLRTTVHHATNGDAALDRDLLNGTNAEVTTLTKHIDF
jgi:hypothetical protein